MTYVVAHLFVSISVTKLLLLQLKKIMQAVVVTSGSVTIHFVN